MNETQISFQGNVGGDVQVRQAGAAQVATFRVAVTPRRFQRSTEQWADAETQWYTVHAWRSLGDNVAASLRRGDPVFVQGRLSARTWTTKEGVEVTTSEVDATVVGHDLNRGRADFSRTPRTTPVSPAEGHPEEVAPAAAA